MNWAHLRAFVWLRWRIAANRSRRSGAISRLIQSVLAALALIAAVSALLTGFLVGALALGRAPAFAIMYIWDGASIVFLFILMIGLMSELERSDLLALDRFLHLPVSPGGAFLINYIGSSASFGVLFFLPGMLGLATGLIVSRGVAMLVLLPLVAAFFLMTTAIVYQFRGWLASLMSNPRRRRTVVVFVTMAFVLVFQLPNLMRFTPGAREARATRVEARETIAELRGQLEAGEITREEFDELRPELEDRRAEGEVLFRQFNAAVPVGWLALGATGAAEGRTVPPLGAAAGMALIGALSLIRSYRTTIRIYTGQNQSKPRTRPVAPVPSVLAPASTRSMRLMGCRLPWMSDQAGAVAVAQFRSLTRASELKMMLLTVPIVLLFLFGGFFGGGESTALGPISLIGRLAFTLVFVASGLVLNHFALDRGGFRAFVLSPVSRADVLVGKNVAHLPLSLITLLTGIGLAQWARPLALDHLAGILVMTVPMSLSLGLVGNAASIFFPMVVKPGSMMPVKSSSLTFLGQLAFMMLAVAVMSFALIPPAMELILGAVGVPRFVPVFLIAALAYAVITLLVYRGAVRLQGELLYGREQRILEVFRTGIH